MMDKMLSFLVRPFLLFRSSVSQNSAIFVLCSLIGSCGGPSSSQLKHVDDPTSRGGSRQLDWHFHTGEGYIYQTHIHPFSKKVIVDKSFCSLDESNFDPECKEKVYYFKKSEIMAFINQAKAVLSGKIEAKTQAVMSASAFAVISGQVAKSLFAAKVGWIPMVLAGGAALGSAVSGIVVVLEGKKLADALADLEKLEKLIVDQEAFVRRCQHVSKDFLQQAEALGVVIVFPEEGGQLIPGRQFLNAHKKEKQLYRETIQYARDHNISSRQAYKDYFLNECGSLPYVTESPVDDMFSSEWNFVPESLKQRSIEVSEVISLMSGKGISYAKFSEEDLVDRQQTEAVLRFLDQFEQTVVDIANSQDKVRLSILSELRRDVDAIIVQPQWRGFSFLSQPTWAEIKDFSGRKVLYIYALWSWSERGYQFSIEEIFSQKFDTD